MSGLPSTLDPDAMSPGQPRARILVVDDEPMCAVAIERGLRREHDVVIELSGAQALARVSRGERFDVILTDLTMPQMTGAELYAAILARDAAQAARMVFVTGGAVTESARGFLASVPNRVVPKPFTLDDLHRAVTHACAQ